MAGQTTAHHGLDLDHTPLTQAINTYLTHLAIERGLADNTVAAYRGDLRRYACYLADAAITGPDVISPHDVSGFVQSLAQPGPHGPVLSDSSAARASVSVRGFHKFWANYTTTGYNPAAEVKPPNTAKRLPKALDIATVEQLLTAASATPGPAGLRDRALLELLYGTGARISEAVALDVDDVADLHTTPVLRLTGKGNKQRIVPVGQFAIAAIDDYLIRGRPAVVTARQGGRAAAGPALFVNLRGGRLSRQSAWTVLQQCAATANLPAAVSPHVLRHSYATHLVEGGADVRVVQELLGHASISTTQVYTKVSADHLREVYATSHLRARW